MGTSCSCNDKWCSMVSRLQKSAETRRKRRRECTYINRRPKILRIRRKTRNRKCACPSKNGQVKIPINIDTIACCSPNADSQSKCSKIQPKANLCSRGTNTCCQNTHDTEILDVNEAKHGCGPMDDIRKNICRFTIDAYFI
ncbi:uncharacterized protein LOC120626287 [Pararge aegeria]|uniref:uncharacterized protein LOC120626287 n=1 Tax=Pararge aegeria TaxID=116150 RepID=UPI0019CFD253|nr:uncharacterized protein LOC120626287 [Pararge aegeria]